MSFTNAGPGGDHCDGRWTLDAAVGSRANAAALANESLLPSSSSQLQSLVLCVRRPPLESLCCFSECFAASARTSSYVGVGREAMPSLAERLATRRAVSRGRWRADRFRRGTAERRDGIGDTREVSDARDGGTSRVMRRGRAIGSERARDRLVSAGNER
jgi:hypothetical protein